MNARRFGKSMRFHGFLADLWAAAAQGQPLFVRCLRDSNGIVLGYGVHKTRQRYDEARAVEQMAGAYDEAMV